jgi:hypothetical protein
MKALHSFETSKSADQLRSHNIPGEIYLQEQQIFCDFIINDALEVLTASKMLVTLQDFLSLDGCNLNLLPQNAFCIVYYYLSNIITKFNAKGLVCTLLDNIISLT